MPVRRAIFPPLLAITLYLCASFLRADVSQTFDPVLLKSVLRIETSPDGHGNSDIGGGFLLSSTETESPTRRIFLVTNKHMIGDWNYVDGDIRIFKPWINVFFYRKDDPSGQTYRATKIELLNGQVLDASRVQLHPTPRIDLVMIDVTNKLSEVSEHIDFTCYAPSFLLPFKKIQDWQTNIADQVIALGYPLGIRSLRNNYPVVKIGYLSSTPGDEVSIPSRIPNRAGILTDIVIDGKFLVVDGLIVPGNSGGPVVLYGGDRMRLTEIGDTGKYSTQFLDKPIKNFVIGVVSYALGGGLTMVVSSDYLFEMLQSLAPTSVPK